MNTEPTVMEGADYHTESSELVKSKSMNKLGLREQRHPVRQQMQLDATGFESAVFSKQIELWVEVSLKTESLVLIFLLILSLKKIFCGCKLNVSKIQPRYLLHNSGLSPNLLLLYSR